MYFDATVSSFCCAWTASGWISPGTCRSASAPTPSAAAPATKLRRFRNASLGVISHEAILLCKLPPLRISIATPPVCWIVTPIRLSFRSSCLSFRSVAEESASGLPTTAIRTHSVECANDLMVSPIGDNCPQLFASGIATTINSMNVNFAERAHNHNWKLDPIVRSMLDTDFYKLLMLQFIWKNFPAVHVTSEVVNRTARVRLSDEVDAPTLIAQMNHLQGLRFRRSELIWLAGNTFYATRHIFEPEFLAWLETDFRLSDYTVDEQDGQLTLRFTGLWTDVTMWEVYALALVSESRTRAALARLNEMELDVLYARAKTRLWE